MNNAKSIASLATKVADYEQVKTIWKRDKKVKLSAFYYPSRVIFDVENEEAVRKQVSSLKDLPNQGGLVIQGTVGQGKSIFLRYLCIKELSKQSSGRIPVFVELRKLEASFTLEQALFQALTVLGFEISDDLFNFYAESGKLVILLDGFDELDESLVRNVTTKLEFWSLRYPLLQFIVTSRPGADIQKLNCFEVLKLAPLTQSEHKPFLTKIGVEKEVLKNLLLEIEKSTIEIKELLTTPLLLTLLVVVFQSEGSFPKSFREFFKNLFTTVFTRHDGTKPAFKRLHKSGLTERKLEQLFEAFCFFVLQKKFTVNLKSEQFNIAFSEALKFTGEQCSFEGFKHDIVKVACLLQEDGLYITFVHKSLLDFFPAAFIKNCTDGQSLKIYQEVAKHWLSWYATLQFLSHIDKYRFVRYFAIPTLEESLLIFKNTDGTAFDDSANRIINNIYTKSICKYIKEPSERGYRLQSFISDYSLPPSNYFARDLGFRCADAILQNYMFLDKKPLFLLEESEEAFSFQLENYIKPDEIEHAKKLLRVEIERLNNLLEGYKKFMDLEDEKSALLFFDDNPN